VFGEGVFGGGRAAYAFFVDMVKAVVDLPLDYAWLRSCFLTCFCLGLFFQVFFFCQEITDVVHCNLLSLT